MLFEINTDYGHIELHRYYACKKDNLCELIKGFNDINECREYCILNNCLVYDILLKEIRNDIY